MLFLRNKKFFENVRGHFYDDFINRYDLNLLGRILKPFCIEYRSDSMGVKKEKINTEFFYTEYSKMCDYRGVLAVATNKFDESNLTSPE